MESQNVHIQMMLGQEVLESYKTHERTCKVKPPKQKPRIAIF